MTQPLELDPVAIGQSLAAQRENGTSWEEAWLVATDCPEGENAHEWLRATARETGPYWSSHSELCKVYTFMEHNFRAAYYKDTTPKGRCKVPGRDVSSAIKTSTLPTNVNAPLTAARNDEIGAAFADKFKTTPHRRFVSAPVGQYSSAGAGKVGLCRSGDKCDRPATHGRFAPTFCDRHGEELTRIGASLEGGTRHLGIRAA